MKFSGERQTSLTSSIISVLPASAYRLLHRSIMLTQIVFALLSVALMVEGQTLSQYSACSTLEDLVDKCASDHLAELLKRSASDYAKLKMVSHLTDAFQLVKHVDLDNMCNDTMHLKMYYSCVISEIEKCLEETNTTLAHTQMKMLPVDELVSEGIVDFCNGRSEMNKTCFAMKKGKVDVCIGASGDTTCDSYTKVHECTEDEMGMCGGVDVLLEFMMDAKPRKCVDTSSASTLGCLSALSMLLLAFMHVVLGSEM